MEYDRLIAEWLANGRQALLDCESTAIKVSQLMARYWAFAKTYYVKNGKQTDELASIKVAMRDVKRLYSKAHVDDFGPLALERAIKPSLLQLVLAEASWKHGVRNTVGHRIAYVILQQRWYVTNSDWRQRKTYSDTPVLTRIDI